MSDLGLHEMVVREFSMLLRMSRMSRSGEALTNSYYCVPLIDNAYKINYRHIRYFGLMAVVV